MFKRLDQYSTALRCYECASKILQNNHNENHPGIANCYNNIGALYVEMEEYSKTIESLERAIAIERKSIPVTHPSIIENIKAKMKCLSMKTFDLSLLIQTVL